MSRGMIRAPLFLPPMGQGFGGGMPMMPPLPGGPPRMPQPPAQPPQPPAQSVAPQASSGFGPVPQYPMPAFPTQIQAQSQVPYGFQPSVQPAPFQPLVQPAAFQPMSAPVSAAFAPAPPADQVPDLPATGAPARPAPGPAPETERRSRTLRPGMFSTRQADRQYSTRT